MIFFSIGSYQSNCDRFWILNFKGERPARKGGRVTSPLCRVIVFITLPRVSINPRLRTCTLSDKYFLFYIWNKSDGARRGSGVSIFFTAIRNNIFGFLFHSFFFATSGTLKIRVVKIENMRMSVYFCFFYKKGGFLYSHLFAIVWIGGL